MKVFNLKLINFTDPHNPAVLAGILQNYILFKPHIERLKKELAEICNYKKHPAFLAIGRTVRVFALQVEAELYAVRLLSNDHEGHHFRARLSGGSLVSDLPGLEKIMAASLEDGVTISRLAPGRNISRLTNADALVVSQEQLGGFVDSLAQAYGRGVLIDTSAGNLLYDQAQGFTIIDYISVDGLSYGLGYLVAAVARQFCFEFENNIRNMSGAPLDKAGFENLYLRKINILKAYTRTSRAKLPPKDFELVEKAVRKILNALKKTARRYGLKPGLNS
jgi:hypothetical protein